MNFALSPLSRPGSQGKAVSKKLVDDPMAPDTDDVKLDFDSLDTDMDDVFSRPFDVRPALKAQSKGSVPVQTLEAEDQGGCPPAPKVAGLLSPLAWLSDKLMSSESRVRISGQAKSIYGLTVRSVMAARGQMESYSPPAMGEFSHKLSLKWGILRPNLRLEGRFWIVPTPGMAGRAGEYAVTLRAGLPILPVLPWVLVAGLPAIVPILINLLIGFSWHGPALAAGWMALTGLPLVYSYITTSRRAAKAFTVGIMSGLTEDALSTSQSDRSSIIALVPARPVFADLADAADVIKPAPIAPKPAPKPVAKSVTAAPKPAAKAAEPIKALLKPLQAKAAEPKKPMTMDAQALVKAQMAAQVQAQLEAQLEALDKAEIELKSAPKTIKPARPVDDKAAAVSSARVRSRIKKFRTRYDVGAKPEKLAVAETPPEGQIPASPPRGLKVKV